MKLFLDGSKLLHHLPAVNQWRKGDLQIPLHVEISPSGACNQRCILCCVDHLGHKAANLPEPLLVNLIESMKASGVKSILMAGEGEPTLNPGLIPALERASAVGLDTALNTNGIRFTRESAERTLPGMQWIRFSMQGSNDPLYQRIHRSAPGDFDRVAENIAAAVGIKRSRKLPVTIGIQQILLAENQHDLLATARKAKELGVDYYVVKRFSKHPNNTYDTPENLHHGVREQFREIEALATDDFKVIVRWRNFEEDCHRKYTSCLGIGFIAQVLSDGGIYPCSQYFKRADYCYGNLHEATFDEIMRSPRAREIQERIRSTTDVTRCMSYCRHHSTNQFLADLVEEPQHGKFI